MQWNPSRRELLIAQSAESTALPFGFSHVTLPQHFGDAFVELFGAAADFFKAGKQIFGAEAAFFCTAEIMNDAALVHHDQAVAQVRSLVHRVRDHQCRQMLAPDDTATRGVAAGPAFR